MEEKTLSRRLENSFFSWLNDKGKQFTYTRDYEKTFCIRYMDNLAKEFLTISLTINKNEDVIIAVDGLITSIKFFKKDNYRFYGDKEAFYIEDKSTHDSISIK